MASLTHEVGPPMAPPVVGLGGSDAVRVASARRALDAADAGASAPARISREFGAAPRGPEPAESPQSADEQFIDRVRTIYESAGMQAEFAKVFGAAPLSRKLTATLVPHGLSPEIDSHVALKDLAAVNRAIRSPLSSGKFGWIALGNGGGLWRTTVGTETGGPRGSVRHRADRALFESGRCRPGAGARTGLPEASAAQVSAVEELLRESDAALDRCDRSLWVALHEPGAESRAMSFDPAETAAAMLKDGRLTVVRRGLVRDLDDAIEKLARSDEVLTGRLMAELGRR